MRCWRADWWTSFAGNNVFLCGFLVGVSFVKRMEYPVPVTVQCTRPDKPGV